MIRRFITSSVTALLAAGFLTLWAAAADITVTPARTVTSRPSAESAALEGLRLEIFDDINDLRHRYQREPLIIDPGLTAAAQRQAEYLATIGKMDPLGAFGEDAHQRAADAGYGGTGSFEIHEAQARVWRDTDSDYLVNEVWKKEQLTVRPIMNEQSKHIGIGIADSADKRRYVVAMLGSLADGASVYEAQPTYDFRTPKPELSATPTLAPLTVSTPHEDGGIYHVVQDGETLSEIAVAYDVDWYTLTILNHIKMGTNTPAVVYEGETLVIRPTFTLTATPTATKTPRPDTATPRPSFTPDTADLPRATELPAGPGAWAALEHVLPILAGYRAQCGLLLIALSVPGLLLCFLKKKK